MYISVAGVSRVNVDTSMLSHREKKKAVLRSTSSTSYFISFLLAELKISQKKGDKINAFFFWLRKRMEWTTNGVKESVLPAWTSVSSAFLSANQYHRTFRYSWPSIRAIRGLHRRRHLQLLSDIDFYWLTLIIRWIIYIYCIYI